MSVPPEAPSGGGASKRWWSRWSLPAPWVGNRGTMGPHTCFKSVLVPYVTTKRRACRRAHRCGHARLILEQIGHPVVVAALYPPRRSHRSGQQKRDAWWLPITWRRSKRRCGLGQVD